MIDERSLIKKLEKYKNFWKLADSYHTGIFHGLTYAIEKAYEETKVGEWIPCSERLPQEDEKVLCTEKDTEKIYLGWCLRIDDVGIRWIDTDGFSMEVIAWMPLPPAYKGE